MATAKEKLVLQWELNSVTDACLKAAVGLKLKVTTSDRHHIVAKEQSLLENKIALPSSIEVKFVGMSEGTGLEIIASNIGFGGSANDKARTDLENFRARMHFELERPMREARLAEEHRTKMELEAAKRQADEEREAKERELRVQLVREREEKRLRDKAERDAAQSSANPTAEVPSGSVRDDVTIPPEGTVTGQFNRTDLGNNGQNDGKPDLVHDLEKLLKLHQMGALSDEEFREAKRRLLNL